MSAMTYEKLKDMLCDELDEIVSTGKITAGDLEAVHQLTDTIKNVYKIQAMEDGGYSYDGEWVASGNYGRDNSRDNGHSYAGRARHYVRGHYSYAGDENSMMMDRLEDMMSTGNMSAEDKRTLRKAMEVLRR